MSFTETTLQYRTDLTVTEILAGNVEGLSDKTVKHSSLNKTVTLDSTTTPPVTKVATFAVAMTGVAYTVELTATPGTNGATVDGTGLKVQAVKFAAPAANASSVIIKRNIIGNGYELAGALWTVELDPGQEFVFYGNDATPDIAVGAKGISFDGTAPDTCNVSIVMG